MKLIVALSIIALCAAYTKKAHDDEIHHLPGAPEHKFRQFAGYIPVGKDRTREIFYWFVEAETNPETAPLVLWTNGGPGCSGLSGFMTEQGPFRPADNGTRLIRNEYAWNKIAHMIFIEQPAGVGFSTVRGNMTYNDTIAAEDNADFVKGFLERFPVFEKRDFYLTSESYGGHYLPTAAAAIVARGDIPTFKGFMVGNPLTFLKYRDFGQYGTFYGHQLLPKPLFDDYLKNDCINKESSDICQKITNDMNAITADLDPYALDFPVCNSPAAAGRHERFALMSSIERSHADPDSIRTYLNADRYQPCNDNWARNYLNREDVQKAIHAERVEWNECSMVINEKWSQEDIAAPMMPIYHSLIDGGHKLRILVYSGDDDSVCATLGSQQFIWDLGYNVTQKWAAWKVEGQTAGYSVAFDGLRFVTVHGAGHMVPSTQPARGYAIFKSYLSNYQDGTL